MWLPRQPHQQMAANDGKNQLTHKNFREKPKHVMYDAESKGKWPLSEMSRKNLKPHLWYLRYF